MKAICIKSANKYFKLKRFRIYKYSITMDTQYLYEIKDELAIMGAHYEIAYMSQCDFDEYLMKIKD